MGDCFEVAGRIILAVANNTQGYDLQSSLAKKFVRNAPEPLYLVHGEVSGQQDLKGLRFGHAWIESEDTVYDYSNGREIEMPKELYYFIGEIADEQPKLYRYRPQKARKMIIDNKTWGPWDLQTSTGL